MFIFDNVDKILKINLEAKKLRQNLALILTKLPKVKVLITCRSALKTERPFIEELVDIRGLNPEAAIRLFEK